MQIGLYMKQPLLSLRLHGMGTTLTALAVDQHGEGHQFVVFNVGDSRVYRYRDNQLEQLTQDHSYVAELVRRGEIDDEAASVHPYRNMLTLRDWCSSRR